MSKPVVSKTRTPIDEMVRTITIRMYAGLALLAAAITLVLYLTRRA